MTTSITSEDRWPNATADNRAALEPGLGGRVPRAARDQPPRRMLGLLDDAALLLLIALLFPVLILLVGMPVAFLVRLVLAIVQRL